MTDFEVLSIRLPDGYKAYARYWQPLGSQRAAILYHHGIQSHCGWYEESARRLAAVGYAVLQVDRRGSGRNGSDRGHAESVDQLVSDSGAARDELFRRTGCDRYHVIGVSWGGKLAVSGYVLDPAGVDSLTLVTPGLFPKIGVSKPEMARIGFAMIYEQRALFDIPLNDPEMFTSAPKWQEFFRRDDLTLRQCTAGFYLASRRMDKVVSRLADSTPTPIHLFLAGDERIVDNEKTERFIHGLGWPQTRITRYKPARHSLEFEGDPSIYFRDLIDFIDGVTDGAAIAISSETARGCTQ